VYKNAPALFLDQTSKIIMSLTLPDLKVLIAEDHLVMRQMITKALQAKTVTQIDHAGDGKQANDMIEAAQTSSAPYHIVFLDWEMPAVTGIEVLKRHRAQPAYANTAFVMVTARSMQAQVMEAVKSGATAYMIKPISPDDIGKKVEETLAWIQKTRSKPKI
jgi:two-component system chemotaxis response regulator CheY